MISASAGVSFEVFKWNWDRRMIQTDGFQAFIVKLGGLIAQRFWTVRPDSG
jgi:hypothetical protein